MNKLNVFLNIFWIVILCLFLNDCTYQDINKKWKEACEGKPICYMYSRKHSVKLEYGIGEYAYQHMVYTPLFDSINLLNAKELIKLAESYLDTISYDQPADAVSFFNSFNGIDSYPAVQNYINEQIAFKNMFAIVGFKVTIINEQKYNYSFYNLSILKDGEVVKELDSLAVDSLMKN